MNKLFLVLILLSKFAIAVGENEDQSYRLYYNSDCQIDDINNQTSDNVIEEEKSTNCFILDVLVLFEKLKELYESHKLLELLSLLNEPKSLALMNLPNHCELLELLKFLALQIFPETDDLLKLMKCYYSLYLYRKCNIPDFIGLSYLLNLTGHSEKLQSLQHLIKTKTEENNRIIEEPQTEPVPNIFLEENLSLQVITAVLEKPDSYMNDKHSKDKFAYNFRIWLDNNYKKNITLLNMSKATQVSTSTMNRVFQEVIGMTPTVYLQNIRLYKSMKLIKETNYEIDKISKLVGYSNFPRFVHDFMNKFNNHPRNIRPHPKKKSNIP